MMVARRSGSPWSDALIREASERFRFLVTDHGFRQVNYRDAWQARVEFRGDRLSLSLTHGNREFDFYAEIKYAIFPRKNPVMLWLVLEALGISRGPTAVETEVDHDRLRLLVAPTAELIAENWDVISRDPTRELFREIKRIADRFARLAKWEG
jgi:hypothetical protein